MAGFKRSNLAPCGINCARCAAHLRRRDPCPGCNSKTDQRPKFATCRLRNCSTRKGAFCFRCPDFPCARLQHLDKRYRLKYRTSEIANLEFIRDHGIKAFLKKETAEGMPGGCILCMHDNKLYPAPQRRPVKRTSK